MSKHVGEKIKTLREGLGMSQPLFADAFGFELATLRQWEQKRRTPGPPERTLFALIEMAPDLVRAAAARARSEKLSVGH